MAKAVIQFELGVDLATLMTQQTRQDCQAAAVELYQKAGAPEKYLLECVAMGILEAAGGGGESLRLGLAEVWFRGPRYHLLG